jgi:hypothetical protein
MGPFCTVLSVSGLRLLVLYPKKCNLSHDITITVVWSEVIPLLAAHAAEHSHQDFSPRRSVLLHMHCK